MSVSSNKVVSEATEDLAGSLGPVTFRTYIYIKHEEK